MKLAHGEIEWANLRAETPRRRKLAHFPDFASPNFFSDSCPVRKCRLGLRRRWSPTVIINARARYVHRRDTAATTMVRIETACAV